MKISVFVGGKLLQKTDLNVLMLGQKQLEKPPPSCVCVYPNSIWVNGKVHAHFEKKHQVMVIQVHHT